MTLTPDKPYKGITSKHISLLRKAYAVGCTHAEACAFADINELDLKEYLKQNPGFARGAKTLQNKIVADARLSLHNGVVDSPAMALQYLKMARKDEFSERQTVEHIGNITMALANMSLPTPQELEDAGLQKDIPLIENAQDAEFEELDVENIEEAHSDLI